MHDESLGSQKAKPISPGAPDAQLLDQPEGPAYKARMKSELPQRSRQDSHHLSPLISMFASEMGLLHNPLWRIPFLITIAIMGHLMSTPPTPPAEKLDQKRFEARGAADGMPKVLWLYLPAFRAVAYAISVFESYVILSTKYPSLCLLPTSMTPLCDLTSKVHLTPLSVVAFVIAYIGYRMRMDSYRALGSHFTFELSIKQKHKLVTTGPYAIVRHPGYGGCFLTTPACVILIFGPGSIWSACNVWQTTFGKVLGCAWFAMNGFTLLMMASRVPKEDAALREAFGEEWEAWAKTTRYKLVPGIY